MLNYENNDHEIDYLLPYGESIRPLLNASNLSDYDLKFLLQKRGVFTQSQSRDKSVPEIAAMLLSPREFDVLKNRQGQKEDNVKRSTGVSEWLQHDRDLLDGVQPIDIEDMLKTMLPEDFPYSVHSMKTHNINNNEIRIQGQIKRNDWKKDVFSSTSYHNWEMTIKRINRARIEYAQEYTIPETKNFLIRLQNEVDNLLKRRGYANPEKDVQKILSTNFKGFHFLFKFLKCFTKLQSDIIKYTRIIDIEVGLDERQKYPEKFEWLKGNIGEIRLTALKGKKLDQTDIFKAGDLGILVFGDIDAEFSFKLTEASGTCIIQFGFPKFFLKRKSIEFETKVSNIHLDSQFSHISKESIKRRILVEFQKDKHNIFEDFVRQGKADINKKDDHNQYLLPFGF